MEAIWFELFEIKREDLLDMNEDGGDTQATSLLTKLARSASNLALNSMPRFMRKRALTAAAGNRPLTVDTSRSADKSSNSSTSSLFKSVKTIGGLLAHQSSVIIGGIASVYNGGTKEFGKNPPSWDVISTFAFHWIRSTIRYPGHNMKTIRKGEELGNSILNMVPKGVTIGLVQFAVNQSLLMWYEKAGLPYQQKTETWRYPVPREYPECDDETHTILGEWVNPDLLAQYDPQGHRSFVDKNSSSPLAPRKVILYLHGGAYILGSAKLYRPLTALLAKESGHPVLAVDYRRAPEYPFPAGLHDAFAAYMWLLKPRHPMFAGEAVASHEPYRPEDIIISGDSAGGGLSMALLNYINMYLRNQDGSSIVPLPQAAVLFSPWVYLSCSTKSWQENSGIDFLPGTASNLHVPVLPNLQHPVYSYCFGEQKGRYLDILSPKSSKPFTTSPMGRIPSIGSNLAALSDLALPKPMLAKPDEKLIAHDREWAKSSLRAEERDALERFVRHPLVSPIFGEFAGLPPLLVQVGQCELIRDENLGCAIQGYGTQLSVGLGLAAASCTSNQIMLSICWCLFWRSFNSPLAQL